jgi:hypothetical protein
VIDQDFNHEDRKFDEELRKGAINQQTQHTLQPNQPHQNQHAQRQQPQQSSDSAAKGQEDPDHIISIKPKETSDVKPIKSKRPWQ